MQRQQRHLIGCDMNSDMQCVRFACKLFKTEKKKKNPFFLFVEDFFYFVTTFSFVDTGLAQVLLIFNDTFNRCILEKEFGN